MDNLWTPELLDQLKKAGWAVLGAALVYLFIVRPLLRPRALPTPVRPEPSLSPATEPLMAKSDIEEKQEAWARQRDAWEAEERLKAQDEQLRKDRQEQAQAERKRQLDELTAYAAGFATQQPEQTALLLKSWAASKAAPTPTA
jgi:flagellar biosynthesis/type III secretory pathway M-ring protein FliF/YscJ